VGRFRSVEVDWEETRNEVFVDTFPFFLPRWTSNARRVGATESAATALDDEGFESCREGRREGSGLFLSFSNGFDALSSFFLSLPFLSLFPTFRQLLPAHTTSPISLLSFPPAPPRTFSPPPSLLGLAFFPLLLYQRSLLMPYAAQTAFSSLCGSTTYVSPFFL
jgi:hypothetical protein